MFDRIQILFERFVGEPAELVRVMPMLPRSSRSLPPALQRPACWRRHKRVR